MTREQHPDLSKYPLRMKPKHMAEVWGVSVSAIQQRVKAGTFPIPHLTRAGKRLEWYRADVAAYFNDKTFLVRSA